MQQTDPHSDAPERAGTSPPVGLLAVCAIVFVISVAATGYLCRSTCCQLDMPGGWKLSMMWLRMPGQTWLSSAASFLLMWLAMMVAMMLPSALPMLLAHRRCLTQLGNGHTRTPTAIVASGYFCMWLLAGAAVYLLGAAFALTAMRCNWLSRAVPALSGAMLVVAGAFQFSGWKRAGLRSCRQPLGCAFSPGDKPIQVSWRYGLKQGVSCCVCCTPPTLAMLAFGMMNPIVMGAIAAVIATEKLAPRPDLLVRVFGAAAVTIGIAIVVRIVLGH